MYLIIIMNVNKQTLCLFYLRSCDHHPILLHNYCIFFLSVHGSYFLSQGLLWCVRVGENMLKPVLQNWQSFGIRGAGSNCQTIMASNSNL